MTRFLGEGKGWSSSSIARGRFEEGIERDGTTLADAADAVDVTDAARYWRKMLAGAIVH
jgi:predicted secreted protein